MNYNTAKTVKGITRRAYKNVCKTFYIDSSSDSVNLYKTR